VVAAATSLGDLFELRDQRSTTRII
jgi:hypothetical protein